MASQRPNIDFAPSRKGRVGAPCEHPVAGASVRAISLQAAFTLVEMIAVMAVIVIITALLVPAFAHLRGSNDFTAATGGIASTLEQARAYAMANNTYVYVGVGEYLVTEGSGVNPRTVGTGELAVATVASRDGTRGYDLSNPAAWSTNYSAASGGNGSKLLMPIAKLSLYDNVHLADFGISPPATGNMARPAVTDNGSRLGSSVYGPTSTYCATPFTWPLGQALGGGQYNFVRVIQFDPQGVARVQTPTSSDAIGPYLGMDLQPTHGPVAPALPANQNAGNQASILVDCMTGSVRIYRP